MPTSKISKTSWISIILQCWGWRVLFPATEIKENSMIPIVLEFWNDGGPPPNPNKAYGFHQCRSGIWGKGVTMDSGFQDLLCQCFGDGDCYARFPQQ